MGVELGVDRPSLTKTEYIQASCSRDGVWTHVIARH
jgi:hypothetical protein